MKDLILIITVSILLAGCTKDKENDQNPNNSAIAIKGTIPAKIKNTAGYDENSVSLSDAKKVLVFSKYYYDVYDIVAGSFSVTGRIGTGVALIFLDANNKYIGNLAAHGLNMLPLGSLSEAENTVIDLSALTLVGNSVIPSHDPFGNEIQITEAEISRLKVLDSYYEAIAKNIDVDNDGSPDVFTDKQLVIYTMFTIYGGRWGLNNTAPEPTDIDHYFVNCMLEFGGGSALTFTDNQISVSGPVEDPYTDIKLWGYMKAPQCGGDRAFISSFCRETQAPEGAPWGSAFLPFKKGTYTLTLDGSRNFTLSYSSVDMQYNLVIVSPTLHTNSDGKLTSITFDYKLPDGTSINPSSVLTNVMVQLSNNLGTQFYVNDKTKLTSLTGFTELKLDTPLDISDMHHIDLWYDDLLGNQYDIIWR
jgi:hypothetical protein